MARPTDTTDPVVTTQDHAPEAPLDGRHLLDTVIADLQHAQAVQISRTIRIRSTNGPVQLSSWGEVGSGWPTWYSSTEAQLPGGDLRVLRAWGGSGRAVLEADRWVEQSNEPYGPSEAAPLDLSRDALEVYGLTPALLDPTHGVRTVTGLLEETMIHDARDNEATGILREVHVRGTVDVDPAAFDLLRLAFDRDVGVTLASPRASRTETVGVSISVAGAGWITIEVDPADVVQRLDPAALADVPDEFRAEPPAPDTVLLVWAIGEIDGEERFTWPEDRPVEA